MSAPDLRPAQNFEFGPEPEEQAQNESRMTDLKKVMLYGSPENSKNIVILVGPTEERFVVNKSLAMLTSFEMEKLIRSASTSNSPLRIPDVHPKDFQFMLESTILENNWVYTNLKDTCRLIETAAQFGFYDFIRTIGKSLLQVVQSRDDVFNEEEVCRALLLFRNFDVGNYILESKAFKYILENASLIFNGDHYLQLPFEDFGEILLQDELKVESEVDVLNALIRWGRNILKNESKESSTENLRTVLVNAITWIRFPNISEKEFQDYVIPLKILSDEHVNLMNQWYQNRGSNVVFNPRTRNYLRANNAQQTAADVRMTAEFLHATRMDNLLAKFKMNTQTHDLGIENAKLQREVERMRASLEKYQRYYNKCAAVKTFKKVEFLAKSFKDSQSNATIGDMGNTLQVLKMILEKILEGELEKVKDQEDLELDNVESVDENKSHILELQNFAKSIIIDETLMWKIFQMESNATRPSSNYIFFYSILENITSESLTNLKIYPSGHQVYLDLPESIQPFCSHNYGQTYYGRYTWGALSYTIGSLRIIVRHYFRAGSNDFGIAIAPLTFPVTDEYYVFERENWANDSTKIKALCTAATEIEKCITLGNLCLHAELIDTGSKAILRVMLSTV